MAETSRPSKKRAVVAVGSVASFLQRQSSQADPADGHDSEPATVPVPTQEAKSLCAAEAFRHETREQFRRSSPGLYELALSAGWLEEVCTHMCPGQWGSKESCLSEALKYHTRHQFMKGNYAAYNTAKRNEWLDDVCAHMPIPTKQVPSGFWNSRENCRVEALKHGSKSEFLKACKNAYNASVRHGWIDEVSLWPFGEVVTVAPDLLPHAARTLGQQGQLPGGGASVPNSQ